MTSYDVKITSGSQIAAIFDLPSWISFEHLKIAKIDQKVIKTNKQIRKSH